MAGEPYRPATPDAVLARLPAAQNELDRMRARLARQPQDLTLALNLAQRYMALGRAESDPRYYAYARAALAPWWEQPDPPVEVLVLRGIYRQHQHDFAAALDDLKQAVQRDPRQAQAWLTRATILRVQGHYDAAAAACKNLLTLAAPTATVACLTDIHSLSGQLAASYRQLNTVARRPLDAVQRQWVQGLLAQMAERLGCQDAAEDHYRAALNAGQRDTYLLGAYADFLLAQDRNAAVRDLLAEEQQVDSLLLRLAIAERRLGAPVWRKHARTLDQRFTASTRRGSERHLRERARYLLALKDQPAEALRVALENWQTQREPEDVRLVLEAALAADQAQAAAPVLAWLGRVGLEDVRLDRLQQQLGEIKA